MTIVHEQEGKMGAVIDKQELARRRARKRYLQEVADVRAGKKISPDCTCFIDEYIKLMELENQRAEQLSSPPSPDAK